MHYYPGSPCLARCQTTRHTVYPKCFRGDVYKFVRNHFRVRGVRTFLPTWLFFWSYLAIFPVSFRTAYPRRESGEEVVVEEPCFCHNNNNMCTLSDEGVTYQVSAVMHACICTLFCLCTHSHTHTHTHTHTQTHSLTLSHTLPTSSFVYSLTHF